MIGIFDSGVGGLSVWHELIELMPRKKYIYVSDNAYCPYGPKSAEYVIRRACAITDFLLAQGADIIVVACNTATAAAITYLRKNYKVKFVGMEPAVKPAVLNSKTGVVGVLATEGTFKGKLYRGTLGRFAAGTKVIEQVGEGLVEAVEEGNTRGLYVEALLHKYIDPMIDKGADHIVLGCTHYPFLIDSIKKIAGEKAVIVNPAPAVAKQAMKLSKGHEDDGEGGSEFYSTGDISVMKKMVNDMANGRKSDYRYTTINI